MLKPRESVIDFAQRVGIHEAIVVGRLQFDRLIEHNSNLNALKSSLNLDDAKQQFNFNDPSFYFCENARLVINSQKNI